MTQLQANENKASEMEVKDYQFNIVKFTVKTVFWVLTVSILLFATFLNTFNYSAMKFYAGFNNKYRALESAEKYLSRNADKYDVRNMPSENSKYADALLCAVNNSIYFMDENLKKKGYSDKNTAYYAEKTNKHATEFLSYYKLGSMLSRALLIDDYNIKNTLASRHPSLYSYGDYVQVRQTRAKLILGKDAEVAREIDDVISTWSTSEWIPPSDELRIGGVFVMFDKLNQYLSRELNSVGFADVPITKDGLVKKEDIFELIDFNSAKPFGFFIEKTGAQTRMYTSLNTRFKSFTEIIKSNTENQGGSKTAQEFLKYTYYLNITRELSQKMGYMSYMFDANSRYYGASEDSALKQQFIKMYADWDSNDWITGISMYVGGVSIPADAFLNDWYKDGVMIEYLRLYSKERL